MFVLGKRRGSNQINFAIYFLLCYGYVSLPGNTINEIEKMLNSFWWGHNANSYKGLHCLSGECVTPKVFGGNGFKSRKVFNLAMVGKHASKLISKSGILITQLLKAKYFPLDDYFSACLCHNPCYVWHGLWSAKDDLQHGL